MSFIGWPPFAFCAVGRPHFYFSKGSFLVYIIAIRFLLNHSPSEWFSLYKKRPGRISRGAVCKMVHFPLVVWDFENFVLQIRQSIYKLPQKFYTLLGREKGEIRKNGASPAWNSAGMAPFSVRLGRKIPVTGFGHQSCRGWQKGQKSTLQQRKSDRQ